MNKSAYRFGIREAVAGTLICIMMIASCGFSYNLHYCHGSLASATFYPGLSQPANGCGCESGMKAENSGPSKHSPPGIQRTSCCKDYKYYEKISPISFNDFFQGAKFSLNIAFTGILPDLKLTAPIQQSFLSSFIIHPPPANPLAGRSLVCFLHQLRIPSIQGSC
jgi:hypothetical protein